VSVPVATVNPTELAHRAHNSAPAGAGDPQRVQVISKERLAVIMFPSRPIGHLFRLRDLCCSPNGQSQPD
jgi:hypothetical protein